MSKEANNCAFEPVEGLHLVAVRATRAVSRGEELTAAYGIPRWLPRFPLALAALSEADRQFLLESLRALGYPAHASQGC